MIGEAGEVGARINKENVMNKYYLAFMWIQDTQPVFSWRIIETDFNLNDRHDLELFIREQNRKYGMDYLIMNWKELT